MPASHCARGDRLKKCFALAYKHKCWRHCDKLCVNSFVLEYLIFKHSLILAIFAGEISFVSLSRKRFGILRSKFAGFDGARSTISVIFCRISGTPCFIHDIIQGLIGCKGLVLSLSQKRCPRSISNMGRPKSQPISISGICFRNLAATDQPYHVL